MTWPFRGLAHIRKTIGVGILYSYWFFVLVSLTAVETLFRVSVARMVTCPDDVSFPIVISKFSDWESGMPSIG